MADATNAACRNQPRWVRSRCVERLVDMKKICECVERLVGMKICECVERLVDMKKKTWGCVQTCLTCCTNGTGSLSSGSRMDRASCNSK